MKRKSTRGRHKLQLTLSWSGSCDFEWLAKLEHLIRKKPRRIQIDIFGTSALSPDAALVLRDVLMRRSPRTRIITNARSSLQDASVLLWLLGDIRLIRQDARVFFRPAELPEDAEVDPNGDWKGYEKKYRDSLSELDPEEGDYVRVLQLINEFLPVQEFAGRLIGTAVLRQFGLIENEGVDNFLTSVFSKTAEKHALR
jgi:hypothetical protein